MGGLLGVAVGGTITYAIPAVWSSLPARMLVFWTSFDFGSDADRFLFGIYPAWKAAHLDPIESLRFK